MKTKTKKTSGKLVANKDNDIKVEVEKFSKTWLAVLANKGTGKINDMRAVLK